MKKILAIAGIAILLLIYIATLISAIFTSPHTPQLFKACVYATIIVPVMFYGYILMYRVLKARAKSMKYDFTPDESLSDESAHEDTANQTNENEDGE